MNEDIVYITIFYFLFSFILIYPPTEIVTLGFTIQAIFSSYLGSEQMFFIEYHIKRILLQIVIHSFMPLGIVVAKIRNRSFKILLKFLRILFTPWILRTSFRTV